MTFTLFRAADVLTFNPPGEPAGTLTAPEGTAVVGNQLLLPRGTGWHTADSAVFAAERGRDGLSWIPNATLPAASEADDAADADDLTLLEILHKAKE